MSLVVTFPTKVLPASSAVSNWFAAHNPIVVPIQRKDYIVSTTTDSAGKVKITTSSSVAEALTVGGYVYINSGAVSGVYKILSAPAADEIVIDLAYVADTSGGFVNLNTDRPYYNVRIVFEMFDVDLADYVQVSEGRFTPDNTGLISAVINEYVSKVLSSTDAYDYSAVNERDLNLSANIKAKIYEEPDSSTSTLSTSPTFNVAHAAMQNGNIGGSNMMLYVPEATGDDKAKWLTGFSRPTYWVGLPFDLSFIFADLLLGEVVKVIELVTNENGSTSSPQHTIDTAGIGFINRMKIPTTYSPQAKTTVIKLINTDGSKEFTLPITVDIIQCLPSNAVYLRWLNSFAGWDYFCFTYSQTEGLESKPGGIFERFTSDLELKRDSGKFVSRSTTPTLTMGAEGLTTEKKNGLKGLIGSVQVEVYAGLDSDDVPIWNTVRLTKYKFSPQTKNSRHKIELTIEQMDLNTQTQ